MVVTLIRTFLLYIVIIAAVKIMGKRQISDLQTSELVVTLLISNVAAIPMQNSGQPMVTGLIPIASLVCFEIFVSIIMLKSSKFRNLICGKPVIIIQNGEIQQKELLKLRMSVDDLTEQLRQMDVFALDDVSYAIMETNGTLSVLKKTEKQPPDASTLGVTVPQQPLEMVIISDGEISDFSLSVCSLSRQWLEGVLQGQNVKKEEIFIMTANKSKEFNIIKKEAA